MNYQPNSAYEYQVGGSLPIDAPSYVVRQADFDLNDGLKGGEFCYVLNSRQMGKSSLRVRTMQRLRAEGIACAAIDIAAIGTSDITPEQWYAGVIDSIVSYLNLYETFALGTWWRNHNSLHFVKRFSKFIEEILLQSISQNIVIFVDEIDSILSLTFNIDDFFALIRDCYNKRADKPDYRRLTFALIGVATPSDLIQDKRRTPFNIGRAIELEGFQLREAEPLGVGLAHKVRNPEKVMQAVLDWTGGQPFLTQKVCQLILRCEVEIPIENEVEWVEDLVQTCILSNWEAQDEPEHLKTIRDRILQNEQHASRLLGFYQQILQQGEIDGNDSPEQMELRLSGLVVKRGGKLKVYNRIYEQVFNQSWVEQKLASLRPYSQAITAWLASKHQDESRLLRGQSLAEALEWKAGKSLSVEDDDFLAASQQLFMLQMQGELEAERETKQILASAIQQAEQLLEEAKQEKQEALQLLEEAKEGSRIERSGVTALRVFEAGSREIEALLLAMQAGQALQKLLKDGCSLQDYPATSPLLALQVILGNIRERNQLSHHSSVMSVSFSPTGEEIAISLDDGSVRLYGLSGEKLAQFIGHQSGVLSISFSPCGKFLATASADGTARLWNLSGHQVAEFMGHQDMVWSISFSPNGQYIATASNDCTARIWNLAGHQVTELIGHQDGVWSVSFSPSGKYLATASDDRTAKLWDLSGNQLAQFIGHQNGVLDVSFNPKEELLITASTDGTAKLWDLSGKQLTECRGHQDMIWSVSFSPSGKYVATASDDRTGRLWDLSGNQIAKLTGHQNGVSDLCFSPTGELLASASTDGTARLWDISANPLVELRGHQNGVLDVCFSPDGKHIATASFDRTARLWDLSGNQLVEFTGHEKAIFSVSFSPDGKYIATASADGTARLWDLSANQLVELVGHQNGLLDVCFSPDGKYIATASNDCTVRLWDLSGKQVVELTGHRDGVSSVSFSPNGEYIASASFDCTARLWDLSGKQIAQLIGHQDTVWSVCFSCEGELLTTASADGTARLWDLSGNQIEEFKGHQGAVRSVSFSPKGELLASRRGSVRFMSSNVSVCFSPKGELLATASTDGTARLWDLSGNQIAEFTGHQGWVRSVSFSPNGKYIATASADRTVRLWRVEGLDELLSRGCEWLKYYLASHPEELAKLEVCQNRFSSQ